jgi:hypothetical protein
MSVQALINLTEISSIPSRGTSDSDRAHTSGIGHGGWRTLERWHEISGEKRGKTGRTRFSHDLTRFAADTRRNFAFRSQIENRAQTERALFFVVSA